MTDDPRTLTLTAPDGWEYRHRPEGGWPEPWDGTKWRSALPWHPGSLDCAPASYVATILVRTPPPTVTITEAQLHDVMREIGAAHQNYLHAVDATDIFDALRRITGEGE